MSNLNLYYFFFTKKKQKLQIENEFIESVPKYTSVDKKYSDIKINEKMEGKTIRIEPQQHSN